MLTIKTVKGDGDQFTQIYRDKFELFKDPRVTVSYPIFCTTIERFLELLFEAKSREFGLPVAVGSAGPKSCRGAFSKRRLQPKTIFRLQTLNMLLKDFTRDLLIKFALLLYMIEYQIIILDKYLETQMNRAIQEMTAIEETVKAVQRMILRGVVEKHIPGSALFMVGLMAMEMYAQRSSIALWLEELAQKYRYSVH